MGKPQKWNIAKLLQNILPQLTFYVRSDYISQIDVAAVGDEEGKFKVKHHNFTLHILYHWLISVSASSAGLSDLCFVLEV